MVEIVASDNPLTQVELLRLVASAEQSSEHPLAQAIVDQAQAQQVGLSAATHFAAIPGHGLDQGACFNTVEIGKC